MKKKKRICLLLSFIAPHSSSLLEVYLFDTIFFFICSKMKWTFLLLNCSLQHVKTVRWFQFTYSDNLLNCIVDVLFNWTIFLSPYTHTHMQCVCVYFLFSINVSLGYSTKWIARRDGQTFFIALLDSWSNAGEMKKKLSERFN